METVRPWRALFYQLFEYTFFEMHLKTEQTPYTLRHLHKHSRMYKNQEKMEMPLFLFEVKPKRSYAVQTVFTQPIWKWNNTFTRGMKGNAASLFLEIQK